MRERNRKIRFFIIVSNADGDDDGARHEMTKRQIRIVLRKLRTE